MFGYWSNPFKTRTSYAFFALHKSGSSYVHTVLHRIFSRMKYQHFTKLPADNLCDGAYYGPVRLFDRIPSRLFSSAKSILQVRDPRDILTSLYFSLRYSHSIPDGYSQSFLSKREKLEEIDINEFVLSNMNDIRTRFERFRSFIGQKNVLILRYETMVTEFDNWFDQIIRFCDLSWNLKLRRCLNSLREEADFSVDREDVTRHKRQVTPGDFRRKLSPETIHLLDRSFSEVFGLFYPGHFRSLIESADSVIEHEHNDADEQFAPPAVA